ncbi:hypothetical protein A2X44_03230 [candidate division CPR3 bacterium GWF2_35_18]|uniref:BETA (1->2) glucan export composite transmembrane/ATP-binding protein n=1 Tax=candidate division CPR3 bacterium GW2011_GWF2_35_18 TaxID=1618350 RepID=A0A0G0BJ97_UNCC3|nr:MAG: BETA (1->2) glucan export composite transmembrane/ATP-binding protein [candidate division CPR3 bacterium GW2011_GWF2_35_18]OGB62997.1 MAG: hypothetical protein A2X44_03230 [candidate division CPR3 bacterium GWF2_35_18]OGB63979.1 MAG: hypothetical protein A2250_02975 [candidate division CPR3 bacterium RIFOXYA2_FULL_35_13]OGB78431.1 MAG: hypothetical protein A2296_03655 [candidate division CPR3 bacterium RIFOXYB2_FULL_35_8]
MKNITRIIKIAKPLHKVFLILVFLILVSSTLQQVAPVLSKFIVDEIMLQVQSQSGNMNKLVILIALTFGISFLATLLTSVSDRMGDHVSGKMYLYLTNKFYDKILRLPLTYFDNELSGQVLSKLGRGIFTIRQFLNTSSNFILPAIIQTIITIGILAYYNIYTAIFMALLFPIYLYLTSLSTKKWGKYETEKNKLEDQIRGRAQEVVANMKVVKSFLSETHEYEYVSSRLHKYDGLYAKQSNTFHAIDFLRNLSLQIILTLVSVIIFYSAFKGTLSIGEMVLIIQLIGMVHRPLFAMSFIMTSIQQAESGSKEFFEILDQKSEENYEVKVTSKDIVKTPAIVFKNVSFAYSDNKQKVLEDVSFEIKNKEKVALVGHSGAGKSTIVSLMMKLYRPNSGEILLGKKSYAKYSHAQIRRNIAFVMQESELFSLSIRENVSYGRHSTEPEIIEALKKANAYEFVMALPHGLESEVGERGVRLSGGQKQRIQIARAILHDAPILILDEATSSLDSKSEKEIQDALNYLMKDKLVIIIAHRFSTIQNVNRILVIDEGRLVDSGDPSILAKKEGVYSELLKYQIEGNKKLLKSFDLFR